MELCSVDTPVPRDHDVRIRVHATTVTAAECAMRRGEPHWGRVVIGFTKPRRRFRVLGNELAGCGKSGLEVVGAAEWAGVFGCAGPVPVVSGLGSPALAAQVVYPAVAASREQILMML